MLRRAGFFDESSRAGSMNPSEAAGKPDCFTSCVILTQRIGTLQNLFSIYPKAASIFQGSIRAANLDKGIQSKEFQMKKDRTLILYSLLEIYQDLDERQTHALGDAVLVAGDRQKTVELLNSFSKEGKRTSLSKEEDMWKSAYNYATSVSDLNFLSFIKTIPDYDFLHAAAVECEETAYYCLEMQVDSLVSGICQQILSTQKDECDKQVQRKVKNAEERELKISRIEFIKRIEDLCRERSRSYVTYSLCDEKVPKIA
jgi:hypothetical protein